MLTRRYFTNDTISLEYAEGPDNGSTVIVLHGITGRWQENIPLFSPLTFNHKVYALSFRGHGNSFRANSYTVEEYADDTIAFIKSLKAETVTIIGHSLGGLVALDVAARQPKMVRSVLTIEPVFFPELLDQPWWKETFAYWRQLAKEFDDKEIIYRALKETTSTARLKAKSIARCDEKVLNISSEFIAAIDREKILAAITCPVHIIYGNPDKGGILNHEYVSWMTDQLRNWSTDYMSESGHVPQTDELHRTIVAVSNFLESL